MNNGLTVVVAIMLTTMIIMLVGTLAKTSTGERGSDAVHNQIMMVRQDNSRVDLYVDRLTGCHYWANYDGGITPRMTPDGTQLCTETPE